MKKILLLATFATLAFGVQAQQTRTVQKTDRMEKHQKMTPDERADRQAEMMQKRLKLTDAQTAKIREVNLQTMPPKDMAEDHKEMREKRMEMMKKREEMYSQVLTRDQMMEFRKIKEDRIEKMKEHRADRKNDRMQDMQPATK